MKENKETKKKYPHKFAKRLTWRIMLRMLIVMGITSAIVLSISWVTLMAESKVFLDRVLENKRTIVESTLSKIYVAAVNTVPDIENSLDSPDRMESIMRRVVELNPSVRSCGISFREGYYKQKGRWFCPYASRSANDSVVVTQTIGGSSQDYLTAEWFQEAIKAKEGYWSKPFFDGTDKTTPLVAFLVPIRDKRDSTVAVLGVDMSLNSLQDVLSVPFSSDNDEEWDAEYEIYYFIVDSTGTYLAHPDKKRLVTGNYFTSTGTTSDSMSVSAGRDMIESKASEGGIILPTHTFTLEGEEVIMLNTPVSHVPWRMALVVPMLYSKVIGYLLGGLMLFFILIGLTVVFFTGRHSIRKASKPLKQLAASADEVAKGNFTAPLPAIKSRDEIHLLRDSFENMQHSLTQYVSQLKDTTAQKASMESELKVAHDIQMTMLPKTFPPFPERSDVDVYGTVNPAKGVGGDLFDFQLRHEKLFFCIGDVSGKGVPASLVMAVTRTLFRNVASHISEPDAIVGALNAAIAEDNDTNMFVTVFVGVLDLPTGRLRYCNAGHEAPLLIGSDVCVLPCDPNLPVGVMPGWGFTAQEVTLAHGTTVFLYTDGLNEAEDASHVQFGDERILREAEALVAEQGTAANDSSPAATGFSVAADNASAAKPVVKPQAVIERMKKAVHHFVGTAEQSDDLTMLAIGYF